MRLPFVLALLAPLLAFAQGSVMLVGGGTERYNGWSDAPYAWFVQQADSGIIINVDVGSVSSWYPAYFRWLGAHPSSHALQIPSRTAANDSAIYRDLVSARGIFIEGGDQWDYVATWKGTLVEDAIHHVFFSGGVIGGTSAGCAILGEVVFDARYGSAYPEEAAYDPYDSHISFTDQFLRILPNVITDTHFHARGRMGRLLVFLARRIQDYQDADIVGIGVEEYTAFCIDPQRVGTVYGDEVAVVRAHGSATLICRPNRPLTFSPVLVDQLTHGAVYDLHSLVLVSPGPFLHPVTPLPGPPPYGDALLDGSAEETGQLGEIAITGMTTDDDNWWQGNLGFAPGQGVVPQAVIVPRLWSDPDFYANRWVGGMYGVATHPGFLALWLDVGCQTSIAAPGTMRVDRLTYLLDSFHVTHSGVSTTRIPGIVGARLHAWGPGDTLDLRALRAGLPQGDGSLTVARLSVSPLPFSDRATIRFTTTRAGEARISVWDLSGRLVCRLGPIPVEPGSVEVPWRPRLLMGAYWLAVDVGGTRLVHPIVRLRSREDPFRPLAR